MARSGRGAASASGPAPGMGAVETRRTAWVALALVLVTGAVFGRTLGLPFVALDDPEYVTENPALRGGLGLATVRWALTTGQAANWHPLTWLSHALDVELFGLEPAGPHAVNLALHCASAALLYLLALRLTGSRWRSALLAALFSVHPLRVESVAWISERKDVLSMALWLATMLAWVRYVRGPSGRRLALAVGLYALGLMSKAMLVTLPFALLLLDLWPLRRVGPASRSGARARDLLLEKWPFLALSAAVSAVTFLVQRGVGAVRPLAAVPLAERLSNGALAIWAYVGRWLWPSGLAVFYPLPPRPPGLVPVAAAIAGVVLASALAWRWRARAPHLLVGWLWYLGTLVPVIGLVQVGHQAMADRYTYIPSIGLGLAAVWSLPEPRALGRRGPLALCAAAAGVLLALSVLTVRQLGFWRDDATLFGHALEVTGRNWLAEQVLGVDLERRGDLPGAIARYREALRDNPESPEALNDLGNALVTIGARDEGVAVLRRAVERWPEYVGALSNLGGALCEEGRLAEGIPVLQRAVALAPEHFTARLNLALALADAGRDREALAQFELLARQAPSDPTVQAYLGRLRGRPSP